MGFWKKFLKKKPASSRDSTQQTSDFKKKYSIMEMRDPNTGLKVKVWVFAEPSIPLPDSLWESATIFPPSTLIQQADDNMGLGGYLVRSMPNNFPIDKVPRMTLEERQALVKKVAVGAKQLESCSAKTEMTRYSVVVWL